MMSRIRCAGGQFGTVSRGRHCADTRRAVDVCVDCCHTLVCAMLLLNANLNGQVREATGT